MSRQTASHADFVRAVVAGRQKLAAQHVSRSWGRCLNEHGLDPGAEADVNRVPGEQLQARQEQLADLLTISQRVITNLQRYTAGTGHVLLLADPQGVILNYSGDPDFNSHARQHGLALGALWDEPNRGTNALGTCLVEGEPLIIRGQEHFLTRYQTLGGAAAALYDPAGELLGVLAACSKPDHIADHTLVLLEMLAEQIEDRYLLTTQSTALTVRFHNHVEQLQVPGEGLIAINNEGYITAANRSAAYQLGHAGVAELLGRNIGEVFNVTPESLNEPGHDNRPRTLYEAGHGRRFYALVHPPEATARTGRRQAAATAATAPGGARHSDGSVALEDLAFDDPSMQRNIQQARRVVNHDIPVLLYGETGTGKELFAKALHNASGRANAPYIAVNCASIPETLIESELFGYKGGAFTGARREGSRGKIVQADGGTLFLDEIGDMPLSLQSRLLRVLEEREVLPLGGDQPVKVDIRLISATHRDLPAMIAAGEFREDLYYRLEGIPITLPALRDRQDKRQLIEQLLTLENQGQPIAIEEDALHQLEAYDWPGNLRQLCNVLRTLLVLHDGERITVADLPANVCPVPVPTPPADTTREEDTAPTNINPLQSAERQALLQSLEQDYWNITRVARRFNVSRNTIYRKMRAFNIKPPREQQ
ncbi:transcriptional regulator of acetoin/glycerol metabolism [Methylohalomonas lacus]|uniref:Transcriptional regulator of acetoin/glycerol metabolism n=1 Tax=Methylohalomonas lacus TaxID=398773 RepID=A0AAE3HJ74_9GAMM|nr:sigma-54-dependent Fis family transcriptional regulator [Methylohalomonas lacus]MCS3902024.1 transcriptional regulator of acetoin/glycerol metabolism [Methylohalomonas lacus]